MSTNTVTLFLALLTLGTMATLIAALAVTALGGAVPRLAATRAAIVEAVAAQANQLSLLAAFVAVAGSLYLSEIANFIPCRLCWFQRTMMYPLLPLLAVAAIRRDQRVGLYAIPIALIGIAISAYHILIERFPELESGACDPTNPCSLKWVERFGFVTIPTMAATAFAFIIAVQVAQLRASGGRSTIDQESST